MTMELSLIVAVIVALNEVIKKAGVPAKFIPLASLVLGMAGGAAFAPGATIQETIFNGIIVGLAANGLFDVSKVVKK